MRIIGGSRRGAHLLAPEGMTTRPLRDRIRESLFNILRDRIQGARVLDAFAGTGAVGLEAISRGAGSAVFIEPDEAACEAIRRNIAKLRFDDSCTLVRGRVPSAFARMKAPSGGFSLLVLMPPYESGLCWTCLDSPALVPLLSTAQPALAVCDIHKAEKIEEPANWRVVDDRTYGITRLLFLEHTP